MADGQPVKWYFSRAGVILLLLAIGPLALPFLWRSPCFKTPSKWVWTVLTMILTVVAVAATVESAKRILDLSRMLRAF